MNFLKRVKGLKFDPGAVFLYVAAVWGFILVFLTPPSMVPDEQAHFIRAYQVSEFRFLPEVVDNKLGGYFPASLWVSVEMISRVGEAAGHNNRSWLKKEYFLRPLNPQKREYISIPNTSLYSPVAYFPQSIGVFIGRVAGLPPLILMYLGRLFNLGFWVFLVWLAIKRTPVLKEAMLCMALLPMSVYLAASMNADAVTMAFAFLLTSEILRTAYNNNSMFGMKSVMLLSFLAVLLSLSKNIYIFLVLLVFLIPVYKAGNLRKYLLYILLVLVSALVSLIIGSMVIKYLLDQVNPMEVLYGASPWLPRINPSKQVQFIFSDIPCFLKLIWLSFSTSIHFILTSFTGILGWLNLPLYRWFYPVAWSVIILVSVVPHSDKIYLSPKSRLIMIFVSAVIFLAFSFTIYCSWEEVGAPAINNLQGRYFIPFSPVLFGVLHCQKTRWFSGLVPLVLSALILLSFFVTTARIYSCYY